MCPNVFLSVRLFVKDVRDCTHKTLSSTHSKVYADSYVSLGYTAWRTLLELQKWNSQLVIAEQG